MYEHSYEYSTNKINPKHSSLSGNNDFTISLPIMALCLLNFYQFVDNNY